MSLAKARKMKAEARELLHGGIDPAVDRAAQASEDQADADTFEHIAREWFEKNEPRWVPRTPAKSSADWKPTSSRGSGGSQLTR
ncbi:MAG: hypothetical protein KAG72_14325 [Abyssibacter sp.]|nr:hypothetical protein [Abyssibacter sp.]